MSIKSIPNGYEVDCRPQGRAGKRYRKKFRTKGEALQYQRWLLSTLHQKGWIETSIDKRPLTELIGLWYHYHGQQLKTGDKELKHLMKMAKELGNPKAYKVTSKLFSEYRAEMMKKGNKSNTINRNQSRLSSVFSVLIKTGEFHGEHPIKGIGQLKVPQREMGYLCTNEIKQLISALDGDVLKIAKLSLSTGARWGEAASLRGRDIANGKVTFHDTKNNKNRTVPISSELFNEISTGKGGRLFQPCYMVFYEILKAQNFDLPKGQAAHVLRHTFASHFIMNGGNILTLSKILGHATIVQTMTYAHLAPDYLNEAVKLNPLTTI